MVQLYMTRRNLLTLLEKLDKVKAGEHSHCSIIKNDTKHEKYPNSEARIVVTAVEDEVYYSEDRQPGPTYKEW